MAEPLWLNFRVLTVKLVDVRKFRSFTVFLSYKMTSIGKFLNLRTPEKTCCNLPTNQREFHQKGANGIANANSEDPDRTV